MVRSAIVCALALGLSLACGSKSGGGGNSGKPKVVVSIFPIYDLTRRIAGDRLDVQLVLPPGQSEHSYDPTPKEIAALDGAKLGITVGLEMDRWAENVMRSAGDPPLLKVGEKVPTIPVDVEPITDEEVHAHEKEHGHHDHDDHDKPEGSGSAKHDDHDKKPDAGKQPDAHDDHDHDKKPAGKDAKKPDAHDDHDHDKPEPKKPEPAPKQPEPHDDHGHAEVGSPDPHVWLDPDRMIKAVDVIAARLAEIDPAGKDTFTKNADALKASLKALDGKLATRTKAWTKRSIVTFHGSMGYFAKRYNILIAAVVEPIAGTEPTGAYIMEVVAAIKRGKAAAIFTEPQLAKGPGETISKEAGIPLGELDPVGGVDGRETYEALLTWNADQLEKVLR
jgi:zinc transport system substrate-binding protein